MGSELELGENSADKRTLRQLRRLSDWATSEGMPLDREVILDPDTIERFVEVGLAEDRSRATHRSVLRRVGPLLTKAAPWTPRPVAVPRRQLVAPYNDEEVELLRRDALLQPTESRLRAAKALLALGLGAGLDGRWVTLVRAGDVGRRGSAVTVRVDEPAAREVTVLGTWEAEVLELAQSAGTAYLVGGRSVSSNRTSHLTETLLVPTGHPRLLPARLRSTWLAGHIARGTRLPELLRAAGVKGADVCNDLLGFVEAMDDDEARAMLRGSR